MHQEVAAFGGAEQAFDRGLPLIELLVSRRKSGDVVASVFEGDECAAIGRYDRVVERSFPALWGLPRVGGGLAGNVTERLFL